MIEIRIYGKGCSKCQVLAENAEQAARELGLQYSFEKVTDMGAIVDAGIMNTPALSMDGELESAGRVPGAEGIKALLSSVPPNPHSAHSAHSASASAKAACRCPAPGPCTGPLYGPCLGP
ncbi:MAG: MTH895/ArsE family thioredoxin-like protein [Gammaproteobacteria bacterium]